LRLALLAERSEGGVSTVSVAGLLVTVSLSPSLIATVKISPLCAAVVGGVVYEAAVAPLMAVPLIFHWYFRLVALFAATEKVAGWPAFTVWLAG
jgi:hypothetical protein